MNKTTKEKPSRRAAAKVFESNLNLTLDGKFKSFDVSDISEKREELQSNLLAVMKPAKKIVRLYRCFGCQKNFALPKMSNCLVLCRGCHTATRGKVTNS